MGTRFSVERIERNSGDTILFGIILVLIGIGLSMQFSASYFYSERIFRGDSLYLVKRQLIWIVLGSVSAFLLYHVRLDFIRKYAAILFAGSFLFTMMTFIPGIGKEIMGARRWVFLFGNSFQPSELIKLSLIVYLSYLLSKKEEGDINDPANSLLPLLIAIAILVLPVYFQNDFSTSFFLVLVALSYLFLARVRLYYFISALLISIPVAALLIFSREYRVRRIIAFIAPESDPAGAAYQIIASRSALARGGLWGAGLGNGVKKLGGLPDAHSDFIFAVLGEEAGLIGVLFVLGLFILLAIRGFRVAEQADSRFCYYLASGITITLVLQAFINISVVSGLVPATGITLPFFSSGGSSLLVSMAMCGILLNISRNHQVRKEADYV